MGALDDVLEELAEIGIDRLGRYEEHGQILRLAGNEVFAGDITQMIAKIVAHLPFGHRALLVGFGLAQQHENRIHEQTPHQ